MTDKRDIVFVADPAAGDVLEHGSPPGKRRLEVAVVVAAGIALLAAVVLQRIDRDIDDPPAVVALPPALTGLSAAAGRPITSDQIIADAAAVGESFAAVRRPADAGEATTVEAVAEIYQRSDGEE